MSVSSSPDCGCTADSGEQKLDRESGHSHAGHHHGHSHGHGQSHGHHHGHGHSHAPANYNGAFAIGIALNLGFVVLEAAYGFLSGSLALLSDAGHNLSDVLGLVLAWGAVVLSRKPASQRHTYGLRRSSILASLLNAMILLIAVGGIAWEALRRFSHPEPVAGGTVVIVAAIGIVINTATALLFLSGSKGDLNIRGAFLHMAADAAVSAGVVVAGLLIGATGWLWLDPTVSLLIALVIVMGTWGLLRESLDLALDAVPPHIDPTAVREYLAALPDVTDVHDLHIWAMSTTEAAMTAHLVRRDPPEADVKVGNKASPAGATNAAGSGTGDDGFLTEVARQMHDRFAICHTTLQVEQEHGPRCALHGCNESAANSDSETPTH